MVVLGGLLVAVAHAGEVYVSSSGATLYVEREGRVLGATPLLVPGAEGEVRLGFRVSPFASTEFEGVVNVHGDERVEVIALPERLRIEVKQPTVAPREVGDLFVDAGVPGAQVYIDGVAREERTPAMLRAVPVGAHLVEVRTKCERASASVEVGEGSIARAELALAAGTSALSVDGGPPGALVFLDDVEVGALPWRAEDITCGAHRLDVRAPGFLRVSQAVDLGAFEVREVVVALQPETFGALVIDVRPVTAVISLDGVQLGAGPRTVEQVAPGGHRVEASAEGFRPRVLQVSVMPDEPTRLDVELVSRRTPARVVANSGVTAVGLVAGALAIIEYRAAEQAFDRYLIEPDDDRAAGIFDQEVRPHQVAAWGLGALAVAGLGAGTTLWVVSADGVALHGRF